MGTVRTHDPARELEPGVPVLLVRPTNRPPALQQASVVRHESSVLALHLPLGEDFDAGEEILLVLHSAGVRFAGAARFVSRDGGGSVILHLDGQWRQVDARSSLRFPCAHPASLHLDGHGTPWPATITDISPRGVGVTLQARPESSWVRMSLEHDGRHATLDCRLVSRRETAEGCALSLVFESLNGTQETFVGVLYAHYREVFLDALPLAG